MRYLLNQTNARAFSLSLPDPEGRTRALGFEDIADLGGVVEHTPSLLTLQSAAADGFRLTEVDWNTSSGRVTIGAPAAVAKLHVDGHLPLGDQHGRPLEGSASLKLLDAENLVLEGFLPRLTCAARIEHLAVEQSEDGGAASVGAVAMSDLQTSAGGFALQLGTAEIEDIQLAWNPRRVELITGALALGKLKATSHDIDFAVEQMVMPRGMTMVGGQISIPELTMDKMTVALDHLDGLLQRDEGERTEAKTEAKTEGEGEGTQVSLDPRLLDLLSGRFAVDVTVDAALPVIGRRRATHAFRVPIGNGIFNYKQLERGLSTLEDAVLDFEVRNSKLVIERDIPIIRMRKNLVEWSLDEDELALAQRRQVRLRTLPRYRLVSSGGNNDIKLNSVHLDPIDIALTVGEVEAPQITQNGEDAESGGSAQAGNAQQGTSGADAPPAPVDEPPLAGILPKLRVGSIEISGCLRYPDHAGLITIAIRNILASLRNLAVGSTRIDVGTIAVDAIEPVQMTFDGVRPDALSLTLKGLRLHDVKIQRRPA